MQLITFAPSAAFSRLRWSACGATGLVALWLIAANPSPAAWLGGLAAAITVGLAACVCPPRGQLTLHTSGSCDWQDAAGIRINGMKAASAFSGMGWTVLRLAKQGAPRLLVIAPDATPAEELRRLRVWLRLAAPRAALNSTATSWS